MINKSGLFDAAYYLDQNPDIAESGMNPLVHFLRFGAGEGRDPNPLFDTSYYLDQNPDVAESGMNPLVHYLWFGAGEGRDPNPFFDTSYYLEHNPDIAESGTNPLAHYLFRIGAGESRDPDPLFDTSCYLERNPVAVKAEVNPLSHFIEFGTKEDQEVKVSIVIYSYNCLYLTQACIESIVNVTRDIDYEIIVADDNSSEGLSQSRKVF